MMKTKISYFNKEGKIVYLITEDHSKIQRIKKEHFWIGVYTLNEVGAIVG